MPLLWLSRSEQAPSSMFFAYNSSLGPPYHIIVDTNFINFSIQVSARPAAQRPPCALRRR